MLLVCLETYRIGILVQLGIGQVISVPLQRLSHLLW
jgi:hypothetical protein